MKYQLTKISYDLALFKKICYVIAANEYIQYFIIFT